MTAATKPTIEQQLATLDPETKAKRVNKLCGGAIRLTYLPEEDKYRLEADPSTGCVLPENFLIDEKEYDGDLINCIYYELDEVQLPLSNLGFFLLGKLRPDQYDEEGRMIDRSEDREVRIRSLDVGTYSFNMFVVNNFTDGQHTKTDFERLCDLRSACVFVRACHSGSKYSCELQPVRVTLEPIPVSELDDEVVNARNVTVIADSPTQVESLTA